MLCPASGARKHVALWSCGQTFAALLALLALFTEDWRLRKGGAGCILEGSPNRKWLHYWEGGRKPGRIWNLEGGKQPWLGPQVAYFWGGYVFLLGLLLSSLSTHLACSSFQSRLDMLPPWKWVCTPPGVREDRGKSPDPAQPFSWGAFAPLPYILGRGFQGFKPVVAI